MVDPRILPTSLTGLNETAPRGVASAPLDILNESAEVRAAVHGVLEENTTEKRVAKLLESVEGAIEQTGE